VPPPHCVEPRRWILRRAGPDRGDVQRPADRTCIMTSTWPLLP